MKGKHCVLVMLCGSLALAACNNDNGTVTPNEVEKSQAQNLPYLPPPTRVRQIDLGTPPVNSIPSTRQTTGIYSDILEELGAAYAADAGLSLQSLESDISATVALDQDQWITIILQNLMFGYAPTQGEFDTISASELTDLINVQMSGNRDLRAVVQAVVVEGNKIIQVTWHFAAVTTTQQDPMLTVTSLAVFAPNGDILFDSLLSMPLITGPVFNPDHF